mmetsp:Transcript_2579/g.3966  ORF Transcript_2579/g.3966 Transcript_2579/m.3966 type:complete len:491 (+) Transcript_2579:109-1581(+)|eukprot:CAMPEP_0184664432 /NCGR_PEP_ID=MMETSP0308-20130426/52785_1 /TAXON_ID=38269 /ORGANISM="Gloeochaete witrockiana, Strain SAG 46.84" /LENGTH=490 /DNA_ID=CAMNT_0027107821 /DNA_START=38 /DNA_END=1510 /DNA_ORIENTATION=+
MAGPAQVKKKGFVPTPLLSVKAETVLSVLGIIVLALAATIHVSVRRPPAKSTSCFMGGEGCPPKSDQEVRGYVHLGFEAVRSEFQKGFTEGWEIGASFVAYVDGELVVDLVGGVTNTTSHAKYTEDTLHLVFSNTKGLEAVAVAMLVDRGVIKYEDRVAKYWPEFGVNGKENTTIADLMQFRTPFSTLGRHMPWEVVTDLDARAKFMADLTPVFPVGSKQAYSGWTRGFILSELCRRVDAKKRSLGQYILEEITRPLDLEWFPAFPTGTDATRAAPVYDKPPLVNMLSVVVPQIFLPESLSEILYPPQTRFSPFERTLFRHALFDSDSLIAKGFKYSIDVSSGASAYNEHFPVSEITSGGGYGSAKGLARFMLMLQNHGELDGKRILSSELVEDVLECMPEKYDEIWATQVAYTKGGLACDFSRALGGTRIAKGDVGFIGLGGATMSMATVGRHVVVSGYAPNFLSSKVVSERAVSLLRALDTCVQNMDN